MLPSASIYATRLPNSVTIVDRCHVSDYPIVLTLSTHSIEYVFCFSHSLPSWFSIVWVWELGESRVLLSDDRKKAEKMVRKNSMSYMGKRAHAWRATFFLLSLAAVATCTISYIETGWTIYEHLKTERIHNFAREWTLIRWRCSHACTGVVRNSENSVINFPIVDLERSSLTNVSNAHHPFFSLSFRWPKSAKKKKYRTLALTSMPNNKPFDPMENSLGVCKLFSDRLLRRTMCHRNAGNLFFAPRKFIFVKYHLRHRRHSLEIELFDCSTNNMRASTENVVWPTCLCGGGETTMLTFMVCFLFDSFVYILHIKF